MTRPVQTVHDEPRRLQPSPLYTGDPVIIVHLGTDATAPDLAACSGEAFTDPRSNTHRTVPRVLCPACCSNALQRVQ